MTKKEDTIQMSVGGLTLDPVTKTPIVILKDTENKLNLPIWIGLLEATAMATEIEGIKMARPMTHDLLKTILGEVGCSVESVEITELKENTYYASVNLTVGGTPGDDRLAPERCDRAGVAHQKSDLCRQSRARSFEHAAAERGSNERRVENVSNVSKEKWAEILEKMGPDDFKYKQ